MGVPLFGAYVRKNFSDVVSVDVRDCPKILDINLLSQPGAVRKADGQGELTARGCAVGNYMNSPS